MRLPFVSRARYEEQCEATQDWCNRANDAESDILASKRHADMQAHNLDEMRKMVHHAEEMAGHWRAMYDAERARSDELVKQMLEMKRDGFDKPIPPTFDSPMAQLGPLARSALEDMARGQSGQVKRAQMSKAYAIWLENRGEANCDEIVAIAVRNGEPVAW